ncbi:MAG: hypothetical protein ACM34K_12600 [Bacillota bacterium]
MKSSKLYYYLLFLSAIILCSCSRPEPFKSKADLNGIWKGKTFLIITPSRMQADVVMRKYGSAYLRIENDSSFDYKLDIGHDVILEKNVLGNTASKVLLKAGYTAFRSGKYIAGDSSIVLYDHNKKILSEEMFHFEGRNLVTRHLDNDKNIWLITWEKEI